jgi:hypothetical protein
VSRGDALPAERSELWVCVVPGCPRHWLQTAAESAPTCCPSHPTFAPAAAPAGVPDWLVQLAGDWRREAWLARHDPDPATRAGAAEQLNCAFLVVAMALKNARAPGALGASGWVAAVQAAAKEGLISVALARYLNGVGPPPSRAL